MNVKFEGEPVEVDGVQYTVSGAFDVEGSSVMTLDIRTPNNISNHLMDGIIEDIMTSLVLRLSYSEGEDKFYSDHEKFEEVV